MKYTTSTIRYCDRFEPKSDVMTSWMPYFTKINLKSVHSAEIKELGCHKVGISRVFGEIAEPGCRNEEYDINDPLF
jgi:hypothetical protein